MFPFLSFLFPSFSTLFVESFTCSISNNQIQRFFIHPSLHQSTKMRVPSPTLLTLLALTSSITTAKPIAQFEGLRSDFLARRPSLEPTPTPSPEPPPSRLSDLDLFLRGIARHPNPPVFTEPRSIPPFTLGGATTRPKPTPTPSSTSTPEPTSVPSPYGFGLRYPFNTFDTESVAARGSPSTSRSEPTLTPEREKTVITESESTTTPKPPTSTPKPAPTLTPDFSRCNFVQIIHSSIEGPFTLTALSDRLPLRSWPVFINPPSAKRAQSPYVSRSRVSQPSFSLIRNSLNYTDGLNGTSFEGRFAPSLDYGSRTLEKFLFGGNVSASGNDEPIGFFWIQSCDALGRPFRELKAGRGMFCLFFPSFSPLFVSLVYVPRDISPRHWMAAVFFFIYIYFVFQIHHPCGKNPYRKKKTLRKSTYLILH